MNDQRKRDLRRGHPGGRRRAGRRSSRRPRSGAAIVLVCALAWAPWAARAEQSEYGGQDWYGSVYGSMGVPNIDNQNNADPGGGVAVSAGFRFNRWFSAEIGGEWQPKMSYDRGSPVQCSSSAGGADYFNAWQITAGGRLYLTEHIVQPFLLGHGGFIQVRDRGGGRACTGSSFVARLGGGVEVFVTNGLAVSFLAAYVMPTQGAASDREYVSLGLGFTWY